MTMVKCADLVDEKLSDGSLEQGERRVLELIATGASLTTVLDTLCRVIDAQSNLQSSIFLLDRAREHLVLAAGPHLPDVWCAAVASFPTTRTACGAAVVERRRTISPEIAADPSYEGFHDAAATAGLQAVWSTPFFSTDDRVLGTFAVYSHTKGFPSSDHLRLVDRATHLASVAVERCQTVEALLEREQRLHALSAGLMRTQDDERRRLARLLHDTALQDLGALKMILGRIARTSARLHRPDRELLGESVDLAERAIAEVRTLSYLLHPPLLDEAGLVSAIRWYADGFSKRSGIAVELHLPDEFERLPEDVETALFRVIQEALINVHRHAQSPTAAIRLERDGTRLTLDIEDHGRGIPPMVSTDPTRDGGGLGVGLMGMRERLEELGGTLEIASSAHGTMLRVRLPFPERGA
jgi:signal transduction histidine kinase